MYSFDSSEGGNGLSESELWNRALTPLVHGVHDGMKGRWRAEEGQLPSNALRGWRRMVTAE